MVPVDERTDATNTEKRVRPVRCQFNIGDCDRPLDEGQDRHAPETCMNCMLMVIMLATDGIMETTSQIEIGYHINTIRTMTRGLTHLGQDLGLDISTYDKTLKPEKKSSKSDSSTAVV